MTTIEILGVGGMLFSVAFTLRTYGGGDGRRAAIVEAWINIVIGFSINYAMNWLVIPIAMPGVYMTAAGNWWMGWVYTAAAMVRQYAIRRWLQDGIHAAAKRMVR